MHDFSSKIDGDKNAETVGADMGSMFVCGRVVGEIDSER